MMLIPFFIWMLFETKCTYLSELETFGHFSASTCMVPYLHQLSAMVQFGANLAP